MSWRSLATAIRRKCVSQGNDKKAAKMAAYLKNVVKFYGISASGRKELFDEFKLRIMELDLQDRLELATELMSAEYHEEKSIAIEILGQSRRYLNQEHLHQLKVLMESHIYDWATCDKFCGSLLRHMISADIKTIETLQGWKTSKCIWVQRSCCVAFVNLARFGQYNKAIFDMCEVCIMNNERFVQLGVGWVLRELSLADHSAVVNFIYSHYDLFSREGLRYAIEKMEPKERKTILNYRKKVETKEAEEEIPNIETPKRRTKKRTGAS